MYWLGADLAESVGKRLRRLRGEAGMSRRVVALRVGRSDTYIEKLEADAIAQPSHENLRRLADLFGVSVDYLVSGEGQETSPAYEEQWVEDLIRDLRRRGLPAKQADWLARIARSLLPESTAQDEQAQAASEVPGDADKPVQSQNGGTGLVAEERESYRP